MSSNLETADQNLIEQKTVKYNSLNKGIFVRFGRYYQSSDEAAIAIFHKMMDKQDPDDLNDWEIRRNSHT